MTKIRSSKGTVRSDHEAEFAASPVSDEAHVEHAHRWSVFASGRFLRNGLASHAHSRSGLTEFSQRDGDMYLAVLAVCVVMQSGSTPPELTNTHEWSGNSPMCVAPSSSFRSSQGLSPTSGDLPCRCPMCGRRTALWHRCVKPTGDLYPHSAYDARPKMYYYFRPYSPTHIPQQAQEAGAMGAPPHAASANIHFGSVYESVETQFKR